MFCLSGQLTSNSMPWRSIDVSLSARARKSGNISTQRPPWRKTCFRVRFWSCLFVANSLSRFVREFLVILARSKSNDCSDFIEPTERCCGIGRMAVWSHKGPLIDSALILQVKCLIFEARFSILESPSVALLANDGSLRPDEKRLMRKVWRALIRNARNELTV